MDDYNLKKRLREIEITPRSEETLNEFFIRIGEQYDLNDELVNDIVEIQQRLAFSPDNTLHTADKKRIDTFIEQIENKYHQSANTGSNHQLDTSEIASSEPETESSKTIQEQEISNDREQKSNIGYEQVDINHNTATSAKQTVSEQELENTRSTSTILTASGIWKARNKIKYWHPASYAIAFTIIAGIISAFFYNPFDVPAYGAVSLALIEGENIYELSGAVYPPMLYLFGGLILIFLENIPFLSISRDSIWVIGTFGIICSATLSAIYYLGCGAISERRHIEWISLSLLNPFALFIALFYGQMTLFVVLGVAGAIYAIHSDNHRVGGALLALSASVKIYPAAIAAIYFFTSPRDVRNILEGAAPIIIINAIAIAGFYPESMSILATPGGLRPVNLLYIITDGAVSYYSVDIIFKLLLIGATFLGIGLPIRREIKLLFPIIPSVLFYPLLIEYRIVALALSLILVGLSLENDLPRPGQITLITGIIISLLGTVSMFLGAYQGWLEQALWVKPSIFTWPLAPSNAQPGQFTEYRQWVLLGMSVVLVFWISALIWYRDLIKTKENVISEWRSVYNSMKEI